MNKEQKLSIYAAYRLYKQVDDDVEIHWHHAFLMLMDETHGTAKDARVIQQLHFNDGMFGLMTPIVREGMHRDLDDKDLFLYGYIGGDEKYILSCWNWVLRYAQYVKDNEVEFGNDDEPSPQRNDCQAGIKAAINITGIAFQEEFAKSAAGLQSNAMPPFKKFDFDKAKEADLEYIRSKNRQLVLGLL